MKKQEIKEKYQEYERSQQECYPFCLNCERHVLNFADIILSQGIFSKRLPPGQIKTLKEMDDIPIPDLQLWVIQELSSDKPAFWLIDSGITILKNRLG